MSDGDTVLWCSVLCASLGTISIALLALLSLIIGFTIEDWFAVADIEDQISSTRGKNREAGETQGKIQVIVFVLEV